MSKGHVERSNSVSAVRKEREMLMLTASPFVITLYRCYRDKQHVYMLLELVTGGNLYSLLCTHQDVLLADAPRGSAGMFYSACVASALEHLHENNIVYRDLKLENVLLDSQGYAKLCDLGFARFVLSKTHTFLGTPEYMAPEMIDPPHSHGVQVDWWGLGVLTCELLTGQTPWDDLEIDDDPMHQLLAIRDSQEKGLPDIFPHALLIAKDFVSQLMTISVQKRLGTRGGGKEVKAHRWFTSKGFDFAALGQRRLDSPFAPDGLGSPETPQQSNPALWQPTGDLFVESAAGPCSWDEDFA